MRTTVLFLLVSIALGFLADPVRACPSCEAALSQSTNSEDEAPAEQQARAYNDSILLFVSMPYLLLSFLGLRFYLLVRKARREAILNPPPIGPQQA